MMIEKIYFDLDGVLSDFWGGLKEMCGEVDASDMNNVWDAIRPIDHYYSKLKPIDGSIDMIHCYIEKYGDKCEILSAIPSAKKNILYAEEDKRAWVAKYISSDIKVNIVQRAEKASFCKGPGCILIDDFPKNVEEWKKLGGTAILFDKSMTEEFATLGEKLIELNDDELEQVTGGVIPIIFSSVIRNIMGSDKLPTEPGGYKLGDDIKLDEKWTPEPGKTTIDR